MPEWIDLYAFVMANRPLVKGKGHIAKSLGECRDSTDLILTRVSLKGFLSRRLLAGF